MSRTSPINPNGLVIFTCSGEPAGLTVPVSARAPCSALAVAQVARRARERGGVARWQEGQIVEESLFYDVVGMMTQLGLK